MILRAAIFDLDGTLIDSLRDIAESMNRSLESMGHPTHPIDAYRYFVGDGIHKLAERALPGTHRDDGQVEQFLTGYQADYFANWSIHTRAYSGIDTLLAQLAENGVTLGVLSNKPDALTRQCVEHYFPGTPFAFVAGQKEDVPRKPDPAAALAAAGVMGCEPAACAFVGDTATDMKTAVAAGMFPAGVTWGFRGEDELVAHGARLIAHRPEALTGLFA